MDYNAASLQLCETNHGKLTVTPVCAITDRDSLSILSVLGEIDPNCGFKTAELADITKLDVLKKQHPILNDMNIITCSDAHYLENMKDAANTIELPELTREAVIEYLDS